MAVEIRVELVEMMGKESRTTGGNDQGSITMMRYQNAQKIVMGFCRVQHSEMKTMFDKYIGVFAFVTCGTDGNISMDVIYLHF